MQTTPPQTTAEIKEFIESLGIETAPVYLPFTRTSDNYFSQHCLSNCEAESHKTGSPIIYGWVIWEDKAISFIEAEFHAVIQHGFSLVDITPRTDGEATILFAVDPKREAKRIDDKTWETWKNHISRNGVIERTTISRKKSLISDRLI